MAKKVNEFDNSLVACLKSYWTEYVGWGRATRSEYWWAFLFYVIISILLVNPTLSFLWMVVCVVPNFTLAARRWHDINRSAWNILWGVLPVIGWIIIIVSMCQPSGPQNRFGAPRIKLKSVPSNAKE